jgi:hypothetical protein
MGRFSPLGDALLRRSRQAPRAIAPDDAEYAVSENAPFTDIRPRKVFRLARAHLIWNECWSEPSQMRFRSGSRDLASVRLSGTGAAVLSQLELFEPGIAVPSGGVWHCFSASLASIEETI